MSSVKVDERWDCFTQRAIKKYPIKQEPESAWQPNLWPQTVQHQVMWDHIYNHQGEGTPTNYTITVPPIFLLYHTIETCRHPNVSEETGRLPKVTADTAYCLNAIAEAAYSPNFTALIAYRRGCLPLNCYRSFSLIGFHSKRHRGFFSKSFLFQTLPQ